MSSLKEEDQQVLKTKYQKQETDISNDNISDLTKQEIIIDSVSDETNKLSAVVSLDESTIAKENKKSTTQQSSFSFLSLLRDLDDLESNPREFSKVKKRLILMTVALATSMYGIKLCMTFIFSF
jgi:hypothetical protein